MQESVPSPQPDCDNLKTNTECCWEMLVVDSTAKKGKQGRSTLMQYKIKQKLLFTLLLFLQVPSIASGALSSLNQSTF